ncbi:M1 family metallopeptidase [Candidatus Bipolaricaulota bacterium]
MTRVRTVVVVGLMAMLTIGVWAASADLPTDPFDIPWQEREIYKPGLIESQWPILDRLPGATVYHIDIDALKDPTALSGVESVHYTNREDVALDEIVFHLFANATEGSIEITALSVDDLEVEPVLEFGGHAMRIPLPKPLQPGEDVDIRMAFEETVPSAYTWGPFGFIDGVLSLDQFYPSVAVYDADGWDEAAAPPHGDWSHYDISFYVVRVTTPPDWIVAAAGVEIGREEAEESQSITFAAGPVRDFYLAASPLYVSHQRIHNDTTITHYVMPGQQQATAGLTFTGQILDAYEHRFGDYPYSDFDFVVTKMPGAMEYPGIVAMAKEMYDVGATVWGSLPSRVALESTLAHEMAHQWFYNIVGNDQTREPWLDEALAQYCTYLYYEDTYRPGSGDGYVESWNDRWNRVDRAEIPIGLASADYERAVYSAIIYGRGPFFLYELADRFGAESLHRFLRKYITVHEWGLATTDSFRCIAETHYQRDLTELFAAWMYPLE